ncbi:SRPBCC family protein [Arthrobacter sp. NamB2]|uniref:SRPBCC family protein n=1 Tax=Arthrobacter sp. NamB2 TaxID=2576035 RepID=UPI0010C999DF|nr:SRPBCC family protein [Arthrobacter sp. NamB2]TKV29199.1 SRPBCC family protein [Arthrobacter sp. NamB2]
MTVAFTCTTTTDLPQAELFDRARSIDAHVGSMRLTRERAIGGVTSGLIGPGQHVTWRAWHFGLPIRMTSFITEFDAPRRFVDEQRRGPFRTFRHVHEFSTEGGQTTMVDRIEFSAPFGVVGAAVERILLRPCLRYLITARNRFLVATRLPAKG